MKLFLCTISALVLLLGCQSDKKLRDNQEKEAIITVMRTQEKAWSNHGIESFMQGYWQSDSLRFYGSNGLTYGWDKALANYKKGYPTKEDTGKLTFVINEIYKISEDSYYVMGKYQLSRISNDAEGVFMLVFKKIRGQWKIIADTTC